MSDDVMLTSELVEALCARVDASSLAEGDRAVIKACLKNCLALGQAFIEKSHSIHRLLRMIFGRTEKASNIIPELKKMTNPKKDEMPKGHGRNGASSYTGGTKVPLSHTSLKKGDLCPECQKGSLPERAGTDREGNGERAPYGDIIRVREAPV